MKTVPLPLRVLWLEASLLLAMTVALTLPFWLSPLDITAAALFYQPGQGESAWPLENYWLWAALYQAAPVLALILLLGSLAVLAISRPHAEGVMMRRRALFVLFSVMLGPGLVVNLILKDHYGRPRPRQIEQFQGHLTYQPPGMPGSEGKSFPCGHCSVGFVVWVFHFLNRRRHPRRAWLILSGAVGLGLLTGVSRMAAGAHFLSDVLWSGLLSYGVCALIHYPLVGRWESRPARTVPEFFLLARWQTLPTAMRPWVLGGLALLLSLAGLLAFPHRTQTRLDIPARATADGTLTVEADMGDVLIRQVEQPAAGITALLSYKGFGLPVSRIEAGYLDETDTVRVIAHGLFTEIEGRLELRLAPASLQHLKVVARTGRIFLEPGIGPDWQLEAARGVVREPSLVRRFGP